ncbi:FHA domain-containing protein [Paenibacillus albicereus]|uniref:FHA domain-containing protein n=1 Tax=Paenibacillus albicereus TaxID=2726185 RepID=A0A6H2GVS3_9BACL|nr:DUF6382 domain-containing protein [Paenibacillus albicereus]QJC51266.1 FHA domain-containing protein [Paenibacillus albicereus]
MRQIVADYEWNREHELVLSRIGGIGRGDLEEIELAMLEEVQVPGLLPIGWEEMNGEVKLRYRLTGRKMLKQKLADGMDRPEELYSLLYGVVSAIEQCRACLLEPDNLLLEEAHVFVGDSWEDCGLVYLPMRLEHRPSELPLRSRLLALSAVCAGAVRQVDAGLPALLKALGDDQVSMAGLKEMLLELSAGHSGQAERRRTERERGGELEPMLSSIGFQGQAGEPLRADRLVVGAKGRPVSSPSFANPPSSARAVPSAAVPESISEPEAPARPAEKPGDAPRERKPGLHTSDALLPMRLDPSPENSPARSTKPLNRGIVILAVLAAAALPWKMLYLESPTRSNLMIGLGTLAVAAAAIIWVWKGKRGEQREEAWPDSHPSAFEPDSGPLSLKRDKRWSFEQGSDGEGEEEAEPWRWNAPPAPPQRQGTPLSVSDRAPNEVRPMPSPPAASDPTVWLGNELEKEQADSHSAAAGVVNRTRGGVRDSFALAAGSHTIGRAPESGQWRDETSGVSRRHVELACRPGSCEAKDLGSRNGTTLNGRAMVPYKSYKLEDGDVLQLAGRDGSRYEVRLG